MKTRIAAFTSSLAVVSLALPALAQTQEEPRTETTEAGENEAAIGIHVEVEIASAYVFRGLNLFGDKPNDQRASVFPSVTVSDGPVSVGYWGAYQLSGDNARRKLDEGFSAENDLWVGYEGSKGDLGYSALLTYYLFPFADEATAGAAAPMYLEPDLGVSYSTSVDVGLNVSYFRGLQDATQSLSYLYIRPSATKKIELTNSLELNIDGAFGYKIWTNDPEAEDNTYDVQLDLKVTIPFGSAYVTPAAHLAWTNLAALGFGDELVVWAGVHLGGYDLEM